jgi:hypothetical protein
MEYRIYIDKRIDYLAIQDNGSFHLKNTLEDITLNAPRVAISHIVHPKDQTSHFET